MTAVGLEALLYAYAKADSTESRLRQNLPDLPGRFEAILDDLMSYTAVLVHCAATYGETDEVVMEAAARYFSRTGEPERAIAIIDEFDPFLKGEVRARWLDARERLAQGDGWPPPRGPWDGLFRAVPFRDSADRGYVRLICGGHGAEYGLVYGSGCPFEGEEGVLYTLRLRSITTVVGHGWPYRVAIAHGVAYSGIHEAAAVLCDDP